MRISVSIGEYAKTPYCMPGLERNVYCIEELCYCLKENAFLLDLSFLNDELLGWIEQECGLKELAKALYPLVHKQGSLSSFAVTILQYVGFYDSATVREIEKVLKQAAGMSTVEKRKIQIDYLVSKKKYEVALKGYDALIQTYWGQDTGIDPMLAAIWHNKGVAFAGLMCYDMAAECFLQAYAYEGGANGYVDYLAAMRMQLSEKEYVDFVAEHKELYGDSLKLEKILEQSAEEWERWPDHLRLCHRRKLRDSDKSKYMEENEYLVQALKDSYRRTIGV